MAELPKFSGLQLADIHAYGGPEAVARAVKMSGQDQEPEVQEPEDYAGWLTVSQYAEVLQIGYRTAWVFVKRHVDHEVVHGRIMVSPEAAAKGKIRHDITRRRPPSES
jgi:hypothetical protein